MDKKLIDSIVELFAILSRKSRDIEKHEKTIESIFKKHVNKEQLDHTIQKYLERRISYTSEINPVKQSKKAVKILKICEIINTNSSIQTKYQIIVKLLEFINIEINELSDSLQLLEIVYDTFNLDKKVYKNLLVISGLAQNNDDENKIIYITKGGLRSWTDIEINEKFIKIGYIEDIHQFVINTNNLDDIELNGQAIEKNSIQLIGVGTIIKSKALKNIYFSELIKIISNDQKSEKIEFSVKIDEHRFRNGALALHKIHFQEKDGNLIGIMGASGAGKTTLLNILNGTDKPSKGNVFLNGIDLHANLNDLKKYIGYVSQDDLLIEELSVFENLYFSACLTFGNLSKEEIKNNVLHTLNELGLEKIKHLIVGSTLNKSISGGQRKRLNIALELIREPSVLFVDEPTSGLSSKDSINVMDILKELTLKNKLIFTVIHQPSPDIFKLFDKLLILDTGGYPVYYGNPIDALSYFKELNENLNHLNNECPQCGHIHVDDIFTIIDSKLYDEYGFESNKRKIEPKEWNIFFKRSQTKFDLKEIDLPKVKTQTPGIINQFKTYIIRDFLSKYYNKSYLVITLLEAPLLAAITALFLKSSKYDTYSLYYNDNIPAYLLICVVSSIFLGLSVSSGELIKDRKIQKRESFLNLNRHSYLISKISLLLVISSIQSLLFVLTGNLILGLGNMIGGYWLICNSTFIAANLLGLTISQAFKNIVSVYILIPIILIPQLLLSGLLVNFDKLNPAISEKGKVPLLADVMLSRWSFEALTVFQATNNSFDKHILKQNQIISEADYRLIYWIDKYKENKECEVYELNKLKIMHPYLNSGNLNDEVIRSYFENSRSEAVVEKDKILEKLSKVHNIEELKLNNSNEALLKLLKRSDETTKIIINKSNQLVQIIDPIYQVNETKLINGTFYSPYKSVLGYPVKTYYANLLVILLSYIVLYISLYFDFLTYLLKFSNKLFKTIKLRFNRNHIKV